MPQAHLQFQGCSNNKLDMKMSKLSVTTRTVHKVDLGGNPKRKAVKRQSYEDDSLNLCARRAEGTHCGVSPSREEGTHCGVSPSPHSRLRGLAWSAK